MSKRKTVKKRKYCKYTSAEESIYLDISSSPVFDTKEELEEWYANQIRLDYCGEVIDNLIKKAPENSKIVGFQIKEEPPCYDYDEDGYISVVVTFETEMTAKQREAVDRRAEKARKRASKVREDAKSKKEKAERALLAKLQKKYKDKK